jgi:oxygen-independent coproporphyrinogen-3 oxidase
MTAELIRRHARPAPRYTSYPTANHFTGAIRDVQYVSWLAALPDTARLSLYLHVPFCQSLCWYCACNTKGARRYEPVARYVDSLLHEIETVAGLLPTRRPAVTHVHFGGGSPSILEPADIHRLGAELRRYFDLQPGTEIAVEVDPRHLREDQVAAFAGIGATRVSLGVQDFDPKVQAAIGRLQSFELTQRAIDLFRDAGVTSVNIDLVYGLPHQTEESLSRTLADVIALAPDRVAAFGYAHLPERMPRQRLIDGTTLPGPMERFAQSARIAATLGAAGYRRIGLDHFARDGDGLAGSDLRRNFQGYTTDRADALIGFGASAIGQLPDGFVQNATSPKDYVAAIAADGLATARGIALSADDRARSYAIERLMCDFRLSGGELERRFGPVARPIVEIARKVVSEDADGLVTATGDGIEVTEAGRPFVRSICTAFDRYYAPAAGRHSTGV